MPVTLTIVATAAAIALIVLVASRRSARPSVIDPETEERWLVARLARHPRLARKVRSIDTEVVGGLMLVSALVVTFLTALAVGIVVDLVDRRGGIARWDRSIADWGSERATATSTSVLDAVTDLGGAITVTVIAMVVAAYDLWRRRDPHVISFLAATLIGVSLINNALKLLVGRERPDVTHLVEASGNSFPSGHSATAAAAWCAFALVLTRDRSRRARTVAAVVASFVIVGVAASRALLGVHWFTDVVAGVAVGWGWFLLCALAFGGRLQRLGEPADRLTDVERPMPARRTVASGG
jgi:membrane-associated phospholipid phosphatase